MERSLLQSDCTRRRRYGRKLSSRIMRHSHMRNAYPTSNATETHKRMSTWKCNHLFLFPLMNATSTCSAMSRSNNDFDIVKTLIKSLEISCVWNILPLLTTYSRYIFRAKVLFQRFYQQHEAFDASYSDRKYFFLFSQLKLTEQTKKYCDYCQ